jgi:hypothetical protein
MDAVRARLDRYLDVVERWGLCPWVGPVRRDGTLRVEVVTSGDPLDQVSSIAGRWLADALVIGLVVLPDRSLDPAALRKLRDATVAAHPALAIADFHPDGGDPARAESAARLVPLLRRSPDPMLQLVPDAALAALAAPPPVAPVASQVAMLAGTAAAPGADARTKIAETNLATVRERGLDRLLAELAALRQ